MLASLRERAKALRRDALTVWIAARDPRTPLAAKLLAASVAAYAYSPIDLIPDFIPVLGLLDDLVIVPLGIWAVVKLIPPPLIAEFRAEAAEIANRPVSWKAAAAIIGIWLASVALAAWFFLKS